MSCSKNCPIKEQIQQQTANLSSAEKLLLLEGACVLVTAVTAIGSWVSHSVKEKRQAERIQELEEKLALVEAKKAEESSEALV